jgi:hypothetical protein
MQLVIKGAVYQDARQRDDELEISVLLCTWILLLLSESADSQECKLAAGLGFDVRGSFVWLNYEIPVPLAR